MKVAILMGSDSDLEVVQGALDVLAQFGVAHEARVLSAHRTPGPLRAYLERCPAQVYICAAGGAAHLAGVVAAETTRPVIALPVQGKSLDGLDSLLSMVQMPPGVPVACVGVGAGKNAGLLAVQILAVADPALAAALAKFKESQAEEVGRKDAALQSKLKK
jgi:5-(carboxyamino)imidazole ribonucleotide mutase